MKIILLKDVKGVGKRFEEKNISDGYAINFLIPKKLAVAASSSTAAEIKSLKDAEVKSKDQLNQRLSEDVLKLSDTNIEVNLKANEQGHLFASLTKEKITELLKENGIEINSSAINLDHPIKELGTFTVPVKVGDKETHFTLIVLPK